MTIPINSKDVDDFVKDNKLFQRTQKYMIGYLENYWADNKVSFIEDLKVNLETILQHYKFVDKRIAFSKCYEYEPPLDYISVSISMYDEEERYVCEYTAFYDWELECFDDTMG